MIERQWAVVSESGHVASVHMTDAGAANDARASAERYPGVTYYVCQLRPVSQAHCTVSSVHESRVACERR